MELSDQIVRDAYDVIGDLMVGIGRLAIDADHIARINDTCVALERAGVRQIPDRLAKPPVNGMMETTIRALLCTPLVITALYVGARLERGCYLRVSRWLTGDDR